MKENPHLQELLDAVPTGGRIACIPSHEDIILYYDEKELGRIRLKSVTDVSVLVESSVKKNYTVFRSLLLGPLVLLFPKKTIQKNYRLCIQWIDIEDEYRFSYVRIEARIMADHVLSVINRSLASADRPQLPQKTKIKESVAVSAKDKQHQRTPHTDSMFIICENCTMEYRKSDLPSDGKCPVCHHPLRV